MAINSRVFKPLFKKNTDATTLLFVFLCAICVFFSIKLLSTWVGRWLRYNKKPHSTNLKKNRNNMRKTVSWRDERDPSSGLEDVLLI